MANVKLQRNLEICRRHFGKEKLGYKRLAAIYNVTRERILMVCARRDTWELMAQKAKESKRKKKG